MSERIEKSWGAVLVAARTHHNALVDEGVVDPTRVRHTIAARQEDARQLTAPVAEGGQGLSQRQAAKVLGVSPATINSDVQKLNGNRSETERPVLTVVPSRRIFETIVIDPPWPMTKIELDVRPNQTDVRTGDVFDYPTMTLEELQQFGEHVKAMAADDCHMFMWTTQKFLRPALNIVDHWGFKYILQMTWHKAGGFKPFGLPQFNSEFVLYARKGSAKFVDTKNFFCCFNAPRREHSRKPDEFYDTVRLVTKGPRIDVFSREPREGFEQWGNETDKFARAP
jgi:N6-adenosine-specific RNA methylase IME4